MPRNCGARSQLSLHQARTAIYCCIESNITGPAGPQANYTMNIGIAGAGLLGRILALVLSRQGHQVSVFDPATSAQARGAAGWTAAGMLSPIAELESGDADVFDMGLRSIALWSALVPSLSMPVQFHIRGSLLVAHRGDEGAATRLTSLLDAKAPQHARPQMLTRDQLQSLEPSIQGPSHAWMLEGEGQIHTVQAMQALAESADNTTWYWGTPVISLKPGQLQTAQGVHAFDWVFDVRGTGARERPHANSHQLNCRNVRGVRGEIFWLQASGLTLGRPVRLLHPRYRVYIVPRAPDTVVVGASEIESEDRSPVSLRSTVELLTAAHSVLPELAEARLIHTEVNLRPALLDNLPRIENEQGLTRINGLFRHGWLIAPAVVEKALQSIFEPDFNLIQTV